VPSISREKLAKLAACASSSVVDLWEQIRDPIFQKPPLSLGSPGELTQSMYYLGYEDGGPSFRENAALASKIMQDLSILPENTRLEKARLSPETEVLSIVQASVTEKISHYGDVNNTTGNTKIIRVVTGDHKVELAQINAHLDKALEYVSNSSQYEMIRNLQESFTTGNLSAYKDYQTIWVRDKAPKIESVFGFVEPYRDPLGIRCEFEAIVGIPDSSETQILKELAKEADRFVCKLPWVTGNFGDRGPFEKSYFEAPDFSSIQSINTSLFWNKR
jgi:dipeptidyl-peptidase-3